MGKYDSVLHDQIDPPGRSRAPKAILFGLLLLVSPLLYEWGLIIWAQWRTMTGDYTVAKTPLLDAIQEWTRSANQEMTLHYSGIFDSGAWKPALAVPIVITWAVVMAAAFLRKVR